jgi:D-beta-D-heptose 7-phosphate kinase/D-beta-D-heptose 1-phosphate adenosyltransferase
MREKIYSPGKIVEVFDALGIGKRRGPKLVFTNGVFDLLHVGHLRYLTAARRAGDLLLVAINDDDSCRRLKGPRRPILALRERLDILAGLECVDFVTWFSEDTPIPLMQKIQPDVLVKGANYTIDQVVGRAEAEAWGAQVRTLELTEGRSTTNLIERVLAARSS